MPIEIKEIVIRTEIVSGKKESTGLNEKEFQALRRQLLEECRRMFAELFTKNRNKR